MKNSYGTTGSLQAYKPAGVACNMALGATRSPELAEQAAPDADIQTLIDTMSGNRHATPEGLLATRRYLRATGLNQEVTR